jgi:hypothetical protein
MRVKHIVETKNIKWILEKYWLFKQYLKSKDNILSGINAKTYFKERKPKWSWIWYFRINQKYRALWFIEWNQLKIYDIDSHQ